MNGLVLRLFAIIFLCTVTLCAEAYIDEGIVQFHPTGSIREVRLDSGEFATKFTIQVKDVSGNILAEQIEVLDNLLVGFIAAFSGPPASADDWLECDGGSYPTQNHALLFKRIGYTYGGSGANFNVPDFQDQYLRGLSRVSNANTYTDDRDPDKVTRELNDAQDWASFVSSSYLTIATAQSNHTHTLEEVGYIGRTKGDNNGTALATQTLAQYQAMSYLTTDFVIPYFGGDNRGTGGHISQVRHTTLSGGSEHTHTVTIDHNNFNSETHPASQVMRFFIKAD